MDKRVEFQTVNSLGQVFAEAIDITPRRGGGLEKIAGERHPEVDRFLRTLQRDPAYQYVLMTPMGAFEAWGMNVNGDIFPRLALSHDKDRGDPAEVGRMLAQKWLRPFGKSLPLGIVREFGYKTFLDAKRYRHHVNKDPKLSYGDIVLSVWNPRMQRCEVISRHDREKAKLVGAAEIVDDLDEGKSRQISMGCKVPFDVCTICGHISRTPRDYCKHLATMMGQVLPDGRIVGAVNFFPRFFDLSDVFVPAAKESGVLEKVANAHGYVPKLAAQSKAAEIKKEVLPNATHRTVQELSAKERDLPQGVLRHGDFGELLNTLAALGIIMKPHEFQYGMLNQMGQAPMARRMDTHRQVFCGAPSDGHARFSMDRYSPSLARTLAPFLGDRSGFMPHLPRRVVKIIVLKVGDPAPLRERVENTAVLQKVASAYAAYRNAFRELPGMLDVAVARDSEYYNRHFFGELLVDSLEKSASFHATDLSTPLVPLYAYNAYRDTVAAPPPLWNFSTTRNSPAKALLRPVL